MSSLILPPSLSLGFSRPEPNPRVEEQVRTTLREIDGLLDILWIEDIHYNERHQGYEGRYALICNWPLVDTRHALVQSGEIGNARYDILGWFTENMQNGGSDAVAPDAIWNKVLALLDTADNSRLPWRERMKQVVNSNREKKLKQKQDFLNNEVHDLAEYYRAEGLKIQQIAVPKGVRD